MVTVYLAYVSPIISVRNIIGIFNEKKRAIEGIIEKIKEDFHFECQSDYDDMICEIWDDGFWSLAGMTYEIRDYQLNELIL